MLVLAWRNVWRNLRRSLITIISMASGLAAIMFGQSIMKSLQQQLIEKATGSITGQLQVLHRGLRELKFPDRLIDDPASVEKALAAQRGIKAYAERIMMMGLASSPTSSEGTLICAIQPDKEPAVTTMSQYLVAGDFLQHEPKGIVMGDRLASKLDVRLGEKVVVMAQGQDGSMDADAFRLSGLLHSGSLTFDESIIYVPLPAMQQMLSVGRKVNQFVIRADRLDEVSTIREELSQRLSGGPLQVVSWEDIDHEIVGIERFQDAILAVVLFIVFAIVALGVLNTLLMSFFERVREFGVLMAIGARPRWVLKLVLLESAILGIIGTALGLAGGLVLIAYFGHAGLHLPVGDAFSYFMPFPDVIYMRVIWRDHAFAAVCILATSLLAACAPALRAGRLRPAEALRHV